MKVHLTAAGAVTTACGLNPVPPRENVVLFTSEAAVAAVTCEDCQRKLEEIVARLPAEDDELEHTFIDEPAE